MRKRSFRAGSPTSSREGTRMKPERIGQRADDEWKKILAVMVIACLATAGLIAGLVTIASLLGA